MLKERLLCPPPRELGPGSWRKRLILLGTIVGSSVALAPAAADRLPDRAVLPESGEHHSRHIAALPGLQASAGVQPNVGSSTALTLVADGAQTPTAIPAEVATRVFVQSLGGAARRAAVLQALNLSEAEEGAFLSALGRVPDIVAANSAERRAAADTLPAQENARAELAAALNATREQDDALLDATYAALTAAVSPAAAARLDAYVESRVRSRIRMYSVPAMTHRVQGGGH